MDLNRTVTLSRYPCHSKLYSQPLIDKMKFFDILGDGRSALIEYVCSDMWKPYFVIEQRIGHALNILDRFHIVARLNKALNDVRASEHRRMKQDGYEPLLTKARWLLLKRPENLTKGQEAKPKDLLKYNLQSVRGYLLKEEFQTLWAYLSPGWAGRFAGFLKRHHHSLRVG